MGPGGNGRTVIRGGMGKFHAYPPVVLDLTLQQNAVRTRFPSVAVNAAHPLAAAVLRPDMINDSEGNPGVAKLSPAGQAAINQLRDQVLAGATFNPNPWVDSPDRQLPYTWSWSVGVNHQVGANSAVGVDTSPTCRAISSGSSISTSRSIGYGPGINTIDPTGALIPAEARATSFARVLQVQTGPQFDGDYKSMQLSYLRRMANRWSGRLAYTLQSSHSSVSAIRTPDGSGWTATPARTSDASHPIARTCWPRAVPSTCGGA